MKKYLLLSSVLFSTACFGGSSLYPSSTNGPISSEKINGNSFFWGSENSQGNIRFSLNVERSGVYALEANIIASDGNSNSFYIDMNSLPSKYEWHTEQTQTPRWLLAGEFYFEKGTQEVTFYVRESNTKVADVRFNLISEDSLDEMPEGVPETSMRRNDCFLEGEKEHFEKSLRRVEVSGCAAAVVTPEIEVHSYRPYADGTGGTLYQCDRVRKNHLYSESLNVYREELGALVNSTNADPYGNNVHCSVNNYYLWARDNAMSQISSDGHPDQGKFDRMMAVSAIASSYFINPHVQQRAANQSVGSSNKHLRIVEWLEGLGSQISDEISYRENDEKYTTNSTIWRAYALTIIGLLSENNEFLSNAESVFIEVMRKISDDNPVSEYDRGFLPQELERKERAVHYQAYALMPVIGMSLASESYGCDFLASKWRNDQVLRLSRKSIEGYINTDVFVDAVKRYTGEHHKQIKGTNPKDSLALIEALNNKSIYSDVMSFVLQHTGSSVKAYPNDYITLGGATERFVERVTQLKGKRVSGLCD